jgi:hypothetical protein
VAPEADITHLILRNARAAERERLRNLALAQQPDLDGHELDLKVRELEVAKLRDAGRKGRASQAYLARVGRTWAATRPEVEDRLEALLALVRSTTPDDEPDDDGAAA